MPNPDIIKDVTDFMLAMGQSRQVLSSPEIPDPDIQLLRSKLNREEFNELDRAWVKCSDLQLEMEAALKPETPAARKARLAHTHESITPLQQHTQEIANKQIDALAELADGIGDLIYVLVGHANAYGIPLAAVWREIQRANMAKLWTYDEVCTVTTNTNFGTDGYYLKPEFNGWKIEALDLHRNGVGLYNVRRPDGKVVKPPSFTPPNIRQIIVDAIVAAKVSTQDIIDSGK